MDRLKMKSSDRTEVNVVKIASLFPQCVTERRNKDGKLELAIDFDKLRAELSRDVLEEGEERYQFTWPDKRTASRLANTPTDKTLRPDVDTSIDFWNTKNLYIEGDNLDVLKILRENYLGKIKMIYIDPPYNTGNDFIYNDDFVISQDEFDERSGFVDEDGNRVLDPMQRNTESNGRFHTDWLNMIYPRLKVARDLLSNDGAIFLSIGDDEEANLIKVCDEVFGEQNFIASICHKHRASISNDRIISENHNHLVFYAKDLSVLFAKQKEIGEDPILDGFKYKDDRGIYKLTPVDGPGGAKKGNPHYEFLGITGYWRYSKESMQKKYDEGLIVRTPNGLQQKYYQSQAEKSRRTVTTWWDDDFLTSSATSQLIALMGAKTFDNPKSVNLLLRCLKMITKTSPNCIILDFFSGSATTAHAVMKLNAEDGGKRKFIMVQLPEVTDEKSEARKAGYENICQIGEERIRRAGEKVKEEVGLQGQDLDIGFRVLKLDSSNMEDVFYTPEDFNEANLFNSVDNVKPDRTPLDLLFQVMPELDIELSAKIEEKEVNGKKVYFVDGTYLIATFDMDVNESTVTEIAKMKPQYFVMRDASAANDNVLDNFEQIFKYYSPDTIRKIL
ncbi:MAG: site-specific DNA-methyltransferase [Muribaculaceae bacterium]|nr:site-specific DNA-methyltransferase [Muribaculaceae bacterium]